MVVALGVLRITPTRKFNSTNFGRFGVFSEIYLNIGCMDKEKCEENYFFDQDSFIALSTFWLRLIETLLDSYLICFGTFFLFNDFAVIKRNAI